jgi:myosin-5
VEDGLGTKEIPLTKTHPFDPSHLINMDDIANMNNMHEGPLLDVLKRRFAEDNIYTYTGDVLISINPYRNISNLYDMPSFETDEEKAAGTAAEDIAGGNKALMQGLQTDDDNNYGVEGDNSEAPHVYEVAKKVCIDYMYLYVYIYIYMYVCGECVCVW